ncbi:MAG: tRNA (guanine(46)-N(7))-methyltransferase TrmB [Bosea sp. (in: a-proteobacteria)]
MDTENRLAEQPLLAERAFFGRRVGQRLRPGQQELIDALLPRLRLPQGSIAELGALFPAPMHEFRLEIGFGGAEHLIAAAEAAPDVGFIGCEPFVNGLAKALAAIQLRGLTNIRLWDADAAMLLKRLPAASLARVDLFYPDPWPKRRQRKRRFVSEATLSEIARVLKPGGAFRFASDIDDYVGWTLARLGRSTELQWTDECAADWHTPHEGWVRTRYEAKAILAGRKPGYIMARRITR